MNAWDKAVEAYKAMNKAYDELPEGVYSSDTTHALDEAYELALQEGGFMDSQIVDECWGEQSHCQTLLIHLTYNKEWITK